MKTNVERVLDYLWSVSPNGATNAEIRVATGIQPHQQVYMITSDLMRKGKIRSRKTGREWVFYVGETTEEVLSSPGKAHPGITPPKLTAANSKNLRAECSASTLAFHSAKGKCLVFPSYSILSHRMAALWAMPNISRL